MIPASDFKSPPQPFIAWASCVDTMSRPPAFARSDTPDSIVSEMEEEDAPDDFGELLAEIGVLRTRSWSEVEAMPSDSLTDLIKMESQTDGVRKVRTYVPAVVLPTLLRCTTIDALATVLSHPWW